MKTALIGALGQLGTDLAQRLGSAVKGDLLALAGPDDPKGNCAVVDVTDRRELFEILGAFRPERIINCAAFHRVDVCEDDVASSFAVNVVGVANLADFAKENNSELVHFSTDYVFDGKKREPYLEEDAPDPLSVYGASKLAGEIVLRRWKKHFIFRTSGLYGVAGAAGKGGNFVETMLQLGKEKGAVRVVGDQSLAPTFTRDLAEKVIEVSNTGAYGLYHLVAGEGCSWFEFAKEIFRLCEMDVDCRPQSTAEAGRKAARPEYSVLASSKLDSLGIAPIRSWREGLAEYLRLKGHLK
ncbi:MAG: dTDP-4-dehydrorhamnose reductase [Planctomycetota bacterium]|jgi:dTDP-4-dehydrorhamnose reductase